MKTSSHMPLKENINQFLEYIEIEKNRSSQTVKNYGFYLRDRFYGEWCLANGINSAGQITLDVIHNYHLWLNRLHGNALKKNTQNYHLIALRAFLKYLATRNIATLAAEKITLTTNQKHAVSFLERDDLKKILSMPAQSPNPEIIRQRDCAILELLFSTGLRVSELASLNRGNINLLKDEFTIRGKGDKYRIVFLSDRARVEIKNYLKARKDTFSPLFIRHDRAFTVKKILGDDSHLYLTPRSIQRLVQRYAQMAGIAKAITPHTMRHSFAKDLLTSGADIHTVQSLLGHASVTSTQIYTHITNQQLRDVHKAFHGKKRKK